MKIATKTPLRGGTSRTGVSTFADSGTQTEPIAIMNSVAACNSRSTQTNPRTRSIFTKSSRFSPVTLTSAPDHVPEDGGMLSSVTLSGDRAAMPKNRFRGKRRGKIHRFGPRRPLGFVARAAEDEPAVNIDEIAVMLEARLGMNAAQPKNGALRKSARSAPAKVDAVSTNVLNPPRTSVKSERVNSAPVKVQFGFNPQRRLELGRNPLAIKDPVITISEYDASNWSKALIAVQPTKSVQVDSAVAADSSAVAPATAPACAPTTAPATSAASTSATAAAASGKSTLNTPVSSKVAKKSSLLLTFLQDHSSSLSFHTKEVNRTHLSPRQKRSIPPTPKNRSRKGV